MIERAANFGVVRQMPGLVSDLTGRGRDIRPVSDPAVRDHLLRSACIMVRTGSTKRGRKGIASFRVWFDSVLGWHVKLGRGGAKRASLTSCEISDDGYIFRMQQAGA